MIDKVRTIILKGSFAKNIWKNQEPTLLTTLDLLGILTGTSIWVSKYQGGFKIRGDVEF